MLEKWKRRHHETAFIASIAEANQFKSLIKSTSCIACHQTTLEMASFTRGPDGWEAQVKCGNCNFNGVVNRLGFDFKQVSSKGKAVDKK